MPTIGSKGAELDIVIRQGATFGPMTCTLTNPDTTPVNITGSTISAKIRKFPSDNTSLGITGVITLTNPSGGVFTWKFNAADTATLLADDESEEAPGSIYQYDVEMTDSSGNIIPLLYGKAKVFRDVV